MLQFRWMVFQALIATPVFYFCAVTLNGQGAAPAIVAMGTAFLVTLFLSKTVDWFRTRTIRKRDEAQSQYIGGAPVWRTGNPPQQIDATPVRQYPRKLT